MKYIRTKERIFEFAKRFDLEYYKKVGFRDEDIVRKFIRNGNKLADTIEELCDGYIIEHPINAFKFFYDKEEMKKCLFNTCMRLFKAYELKVFGCIKTDKGLIYVAKMNDKGELELL